MLHRHLNHKGFTLAAIDDIISRGLWADWQTLRRAALDDPVVMTKVLRVCLAYANDPYEQRHHFWRHYAQKHGAVKDDSWPEPAPALGSKHGIETGILEFTRSMKPTSADDYIDLIVPGPHLKKSVSGITRTARFAAPPEILRFFGMRILERNATMDYINFRTSCERLGPVGTAMALVVFDEIYPQSNGQSPLQQLLVQMARPLPYYLRNTTPEGWAAVEKAGLLTALDCFDRVCDHFEYMKRFASAATITARRPSDP